MAAGTKIKDDNQEYQFSLPFVTPSGHQFSFYDTPDNQRLVIQHSSGSHIEFKADGGVLIKAVGDLHTASSIKSTQSEMASGADNTTNRQDTDYTWEVGGRLRIKCASLDFEIGSTGRIFAGTDLITSGNNVITKATESISLEGTKSVYVDTKEMRERIVSRQSEVGTMEGSSGSTPSGGLNVMKVYGNTVIQNDDINGGITIASKGYLNLVAGKERVDLIGKFTETPAVEARGTWTQKVFANKGLLDVSTAPGDYVFESDAGASYTYAQKLPRSSVSETNGLQTTIKMGNFAETITLGNLTQTTLLGNHTTNILKGDMAQTVSAGNRTRAVGLNETVTIGGMLSVKATKIYLN